MKNDSQKIDLRKKYLTLRKKELSKNKLLIYQQVELYLRRRLSSKNSTSNLYTGIYWPLNGEVDLRDLKRSLNFPLALPFCDKKGILQYKKWSTNNLRKDNAGIPSPTEEENLKPEEIGLLLIPALAIDLNGQRLGYGGGYFDRLRSNPKWQAIKSLVILPSNCISKKPFPVDSWDVPFNSCITEKGTYEINNALTS